MRRFLGLLCALVTVVSCDTDHNATTPLVFTAPASIPAATSTTSAPVSTVIDALTIAAPNTTQPYRRAMFGDDWIDADGDCHNTRAEVLMQETAAPVTFNPNGCTVNTGRWTDPWSAFSSSNAADFQIDHTIPLADAWRSGAWAWDDARRLAFANDLGHPETLNAVRGTVNESKGDKTPDQWKPPLRDSWCLYATDWALIKTTWQLTATAAEAAALRSMAATC